MEGRTVLFRGKNAPLQGVNQGTSSKPLLLTLQEKIGFISSGRKVYG